MRRAVFRNVDTRSAQMGGRAGKVRIIHSTLYCLYRLTSCRSMNEDQTFSNKRYFYQCFLYIQSIDIQYPAVSSFLMHYLVCLGSAARMFVYCRFWKRFSSFSYAAAKWKVNDAIIKWYHQIIRRWSDWLTDWSDWLTDWLYWLTVLTNWLYWLTVLTDCTDWLYWLTVLTDWLTDWSDWLTDWLTNWLTVLSDCTDWLTD